MVWFRISTQPTGDQTMDSHNTKDRTNFSYATNAPHQLLLSQITLLNLH